MSRWRALVAVIALAACGKSADPPSGGSADPDLVVRDAQAAVTPGVFPGKHPKPACPAADKVVLVEPLYDAADESGQPVGWNLPLTALPAPEGAVTTKITADEAKGLGVASVPKTVWIYHPGQPACRGKVGDLYENLDDAPGSMSIDARVDGCPPPGRDESGPWFGLAVDAEPKGCDLALATTIAERVGEADGEAWVRPSKDTPIPPAIAPVLPRPKAACAAPDCEALWRVRAVEIAGKPAAWDATLTWARPDASLALCALAHDDDHALIGPAKGGPRRVDEPGAWQRLYGAFYDATGARTLLLEGRGTYVVRPVAADGTIGAPITRVWYLPDQTESPTWSLAQYCGE